MKTSPRRLAAARARTMRWYNLNADRSIARSTAWRKDNPQRYAEQRRRRRVLVGAWSDAT